MAHEPCRAHRPPPTQDSQEVASPGTWAVRAGLAPSTGRWIQPPFLTAEWSPAWFSRSQVVQPSREFCEFLTLTFRRVWSPRWFSLFVAGIPSDEGGTAGCHQKQLTNAGTRATRSES